MRIVSIREMVVGKGYSIGVEEGQILSESRVDREFCNLVCDQFIPPNAQNRSILGGGSVGHGHLVRSRGRRPVVEERTPGRSLGLRRLLQTIADGLAGHAKVVQVGHASLAPVGTVEERDAIVREPR